MTDEVENTMLDLLNAGVIEIAGRDEDGAPFFRIIDEAKLEALIAEAEAAQ